MKVPSGAGGCVGTIHAVPPSRSSSVAAGRYRLGASVPPPVSDAAGEWRGVGRSHLLLHMIALVAYASAHTRGSRPHNDIAGTQSL